MRSGFDFPTSAAWWCDYLPSQRGYIRYVDDFVLFGESRSQLREWGDQLRAGLGDLGLTIHPDKYRNLSTAKGVDICGFVVFADGRRRVRSSSARRFSRRYSRMRQAVNKGELPVEKVTESVRAWIGHVQHAQSYRLRSAILSPRMPSG